MEFPVSFYILPIDIVVYYLVLYPILITLVANGVILEKLYLYMYYELKFKMSTDRSMICIGIESVLIYACTVQCTV